MTFSRLSLAKYNHLFITLFTISSIYGFSYLQLHFDKLIESEFKTLKLNEEFLEILQVFSETFFFWELFWLWI